MKRALLVVLASLVFVGGAAGATSPPRVLAITFGPDLEINPVTQDYVTSQLTRTQSVNLEDARAKVRELIEAALVRPLVRRATRPSRSSREARLSGKKQRGAVKRLRDRPGDWA